MGVEEEEEGRGGRRVGRALPAMLDVVGSGGYAGLGKFVVDRGRSLSR